MRTLTVALVAAGTMLGSTMAHATPPQPGPGLQGCGFVAVPDSTPGGQFGGPDVWNGIVYGGPIVVADTQDLFANAVDGTLTCTLLVNDVPQGDVLNPGGALQVHLSSYVIFGAASLTYTAGPTDDVTLCGRLDLVNAHDEQATYDLGCTRNGVIPGATALCAVTQFLPLPVRPVVEEHLGC